MPYSAHYEQEISYLRRDNVGNMLTCTDRGMMQKCLN